MRRNERGMAMITTLLVMMMVSALMVGFTALVMSDQRFRGIDRDRTQSFYAAHAGLEKLTADLGNLFLVNVAPTAAQITALTTLTPALPGVSFTAAGGGSGYNIVQGAPVSQPISSGPYQGLIGLLTKYDIDVTAKTLAGGEVHLQRQVQTVAIPVFQFGMFSDVDLSFFAGANFNFGGRVHTNGNLFLSGGAPLTISDKVTAVKEVIRQNLSNGASIDTAPAHASNVSIATAPGAFRNLLRTEGSLVGTLGSAANEPTWHNVSLSSYNGYIRNGTTGAKALNLPLLTLGGTNPDLVRRPPTPTEDVTNATLFGERFFTKASLRILLSDTQTDLTTFTLPGVDNAVQPRSLEGDWDAAPPAWYNAGVLDAAHPALAKTGTPFATTTAANTAAGDAFIRVAVLPPAGFGFPASFWVNGTQVTCTGSTAVPNNRLTGCTGVPVSVNGAPVTTGYLSNVNTNTVGGFIKIERQSAAGVWTDVTQEILNWGFAAANLNGACADPSPNAIIRFQRVANVPVAGGACGLTAPATTAGTDYWPLALFDPREALVRDAAAASPLVGGLMYYVQLDVRNLSQWFTNAGVYAGGTGNQSVSNNGFTVYFSDRRNNRNAVSQETGEYGWEDIINPAVAAGTANGVLDAGEDVNANAILDVYGQFPNYNGVANAVPPGALAPLDAAARPGTAVSAAQAQVNRPLLFRRALKLVNGGLGNIVMPGLSIVAENPVYVQGDWNANQAAGFGAGNAATSIIADSVTLLSNNWNDRNSFSSSYALAGRPRSAQSYYRFATIAGKNPSFPQPTAWAAATDFGTDGGAHNFLRMLEQGGTVNYRGAIATFFYSRQANGIYKCCNTVYGAPTRVFNFDTNFLTPALLPPMTPVFRDVNTLTFSQEIRPGR